MNLPEIKLISFDICPYVQKSVILLEFKKIPFKTIYIDIFNKPDWFLMKSPTGKVPLLEIDSKHIIFESTVINEYLNEVTNANLLPSESIERAKHRSYIEYSNLVLISLFQFMTATNELDYLKHEDILFKELTNIESISTESFFNTKDLNLVDIAFAPIFIRLKMLKEKFQINFLEDFPKVVKWSEKILSQDAVIKSIDDELFSKYCLYLQKRNAKIFHDLKVCR
ncbi:glutathione S-transferase family protein [bacterium]|nr:glutathione S-transferase family protein [bacterium]